MKLRTRAAIDLLETANQPFVMAIRESSTHPALMFKKKSPKRHGIILSGRQMRDWDELSATFASAFRFPYYYGQNWDALIDCMQDLSWPPFNNDFENILLIIANGDQVLIREPNEFSILHSVLEDISRYWAEPVRDGQLWDHEPTPFHAIFILPDHLKGARGLEMIYD